MIDSVVFDLDGTLIDSLPDVLASMNLMLAEEKRGPLSLAELRNMVGRGVTPMVEDAFSMKGNAIASPIELKDAVQRYINHYKANPVGHTVVFPNVIETLEKLKGKGFCMGICTNKPYEMTLLVLEGLKIDIFFDGVTGGDNLPFKQQTRPTPYFDHVRVDEIRS